MTDETKQNEILEAYKAANKERYNQEPGSVPIKKGQVLTFIDGGKDVGWKEIDWQLGTNKGKRHVFLTKEGHEVSFKQILRRNNGLGLSGTREAMLTEFLGRIDGNYAVTVADTFKQESSYYEGKDVFLVFEAAVAE